MPVVAGMIAVGKAWTVRTLEELAAQRRSPAGEDLFQDLPIPPGHGRTEACQIIRSQLPEQLMDAETLTTAAGGTVHQRSLMN